MLLELGKPARVFVFELHPGRAVGVFLGKRADAFVVDEPRHRVDLGPEFVLRAFLGAVAAACHDQRQRLGRVAKPEMQRREPTHRQADDVRLGDAHSLQHGSDIVGSTGLRIFPDVVRHIRGRITPRGERYGAIALPEMPHLGFPGAMIGSIFMHENHGGAGAALLVIKLYPVVGHYVWHRNSPSL